MNVDLYLAVEILSTALSLGFLLLLMRQSIWCWPLGIAGSALAVFLFVWPGAEVKLYAEAVLYSYYVWIGIYGWFRWRRGRLEEESVKTWGWKKHAIFLLGSAVLAPGLGYLLSVYTDSNNPFVDAATTVFSFLASYMQAEKIYTSWHLWILINGVTTWLYYTRELYVFSGLMVVYFILSVAGLISWRRDLEVKGW